MLPVLRGVDCFAYQPAVRDLIGPVARESWGWLFDDRLRGHVGLLSDPVLGMIEAALATEASRNISFDDIGNLSIEDIDLVADTLIQLKKLGHFRGVWSNYEEAARLMQRGALVQSMFTPGATRLRREKLPVTIANPIEGARLAFRSLHLVGDAWEGARRSLRLSELVGRGLAECVPLASRLLRLLPRTRAQLSGAGRVGLLV